MYKKPIVFTAACVGMLLFGISLITLGSLATDLTTKFRLAGKSAGLLFSILPIGILTGSLIFGPVCDSYGYKLLLVLSALAMFGGFHGIAGADSIPFLYVCTYIFGVSGGIINGATNALVADISDENKGANLSLLGVFFGVGALGMPLVLGLLSAKFNAFQVVAGIGWLTLATAVFYMFIQFPGAKQKKGISSSEWKTLFQLLLVLIGFFLFFQSGLESIINNWTTTYLITTAGVAKSNALYVLSIHVVGMIVMRLLMGSVFRKIPQTRLMWTCLLLLLAGIVMMLAHQRFAVLAVGLFLSGSGLAGGFPIMLGWVGERFEHISATAFSFVFTLALIGNMQINYLMGIIVEKFGVQHLITTSIFITACMSILCSVIIRNIKPTNKHLDYAGKTMANQCQERDD
jgi:MFS family permease